MNIAEVKTKLEKVTTQKQLFALLGRIEKQQRNLPFYKECLSLCATKNAEIVRAERWQFTK